MNAKEVYYIFRDEFEYKFKNVKSPKFEIYHLKLLKNLLNEQGEEKVLGIIEFTIRNWECIKDKLKVVGFPTISILWSWRFPIMELMNKPLRKNSVEYRKNERVDKKVSTKELFISI